MGDCNNSCQPTACCTCDNKGNNNLLLILLLLGCGGNNCGINMCGNNSNSCDTILWLLILSCVCGSGSIF